MINKLYIHTYYYVCKRKFTILLLFVFLITMIVYLLLHVIFYVKTVSSDDPRIIAIHKNYLFLLQGVGANPDDIKIASINILNKSIDALSKKYIGGPNGLLMDITDEYCVMKGVSKIKNWAPANAENILYFYNVATKMYQGVLRLNDLWGGDIAWDGKEGFFFNKYSKDRRYCNIMHYNLMTSKTVCILGDVRAFSFAFNKTNSSIVYLDQDAKNGKFKFLSVTLPGCIKSEFKPNDGLYSKVYVPFSFSSDNGYFSYQFGSSAKVIDMGTNKTVRIYNAFRHIWAKNSHFICTYGNARDGDVIGMLYDVMTYDLFRKFHFPEISIYSPEGNWRYKILDTDYGYNLFVIPREWKTAKYLLKK